MGIATYLAVLRRRWLALLVAILAGGAGAALLVARTPKEYRATTTLVVILPETTDPSSQNSAVQVANGLLATFAKLVATRKTASEVESTLGLPPGAAAGRLAGAGLSGTFFLGVSAVSENPGTARSLADAGADSLVHQVADLEKDQQRPISVSVVDRAALPSQPFKPTPQTTITLGLLVGLVAGVGLLVLLEALDRSVRSGDQASALARAPVLASVPKRRGSAASRLVVDDAASEPYRALRTAVRYLNPDRPPRVLLVTSAIPGDGKTTTATNLAIALASSGENVVLVDADLRRTQLSRALGVHKSPGLTDAVTSQAELMSTLRREGSVYILPAGRIPPNPSELLGSQAMAAVLEQLSATADLVVIDTPPMLTVTDAEVLAAQVDAVLVVVKQGHTPRPALAECARRLQAVGAPIAGIVLNATTRSDPSGYYGQYVYTTSTAPWRQRRRSA